jgi:hypothetical protein
MSYSGVLGRPSAYLGNLVLGQLDAAANLPPPGQVIDTAVSAGQVEQGRVLAGENPALTAAPPPPQRQAVRAVVKAEEPAPDLLAGRTAHSRPPQLPLPPTPFPGAVIRAEEPPPDPGWVRGTPHGFAPAQPKPVPGQIIRAEEPPPDPGAVLKHVPFRFTPAPVVQTPIPWEIHAEEPPPDPGRVEHGPLGLFTPPLPVPCPYVPAKFTTRERRPRRPDTCTS